MAGQGSRIGSAYNSTVAMSDGEIAEEDEATGGTEEVQGDTIEDDEAEYASFLEQERKDFESAASRRRLETQRSQDRTVSTRRKVREMDTFNNSDQVLDYGDEDGGIAKPPLVGSTKETIPDTHLQGRKIWWPTIGV